MLKYIARITSKQKLKSIIPGIFGSKLSYAMPAYWVVSGLTGYRSYEPNKITTTKQDVIKLQTQQRQSALLLLPEVHGIDLRPTDTFLSDLGWLSVHQLMVWNCIKLFLEILVKQKPHYLAKQISWSRETRTSIGQITQHKTGLNITDENFLIQGIRIYNRIPMVIRQISDLKIKMWMTHDWVIKETRLSFQSRELENTILSRAWICKFPSTYTRLQVSKQNPKQSCTKCIVESNVLCLFVFLFGCLSF